MKSGEVEAASVSDERENKAEKPFQILMSFNNNNNIRFLETHIKTLCVNNKIKYYQ